MKNIFLHLVCFGLLAFSSIWTQNPREFLPAFVPPFPQQVAPAPPKGKVLGPGLFNHIPPVREAYHAGTSIFAGHTPRGELYLRQEAEEELKILAKPKEGWRWDIADALWSPDGNRLIVKQVDDRGVPRIKLVKNDSIIEWPYTRAGEALSKHQYHIVDLDRNSITPVAREADKVYFHPLSWSEDGKEIRMVQADRLMKKLELLRVDARSGKTDTWFSDSSNEYLIGLDLLHGYTGRLRRANHFYFLDSRDEFIYKNEASGYYQLELRDKYGNLLRPLTSYSRNGLVTQLIDVDTTRGWAYFIGQGDPMQPYEEQLYRSSLGELRIEKIADGPYFPEIFLNKAKDSIYIWRNDMEKFSKLEVYAVESNKLSTTWTADMSPVKELGFSPEFIPLTASDGKTRIETMLFKPKDFDPDHTYPVVEWIYGASHSEAISRTLMFPGNIQLQQLANAGFIVVVIDGRGTPGRGKEFRNLSYGRFGLLEMADHIKALKDLASQKPYMDLDRLGISGHSWGGHYALRAALEHPDLYKAAHLSAPAIDPLHFRVPIEIYMGCLPADCPEAYKASALTPRLDRIKAPLLIHHGTADDDVPIDDSYFLVDELKKIGNNNYELRELPGMDHIVMMHPAWEKEMIEFFKRQLGKVSLN